jgi:4a-hydroxytetrahydrobiopterin dehydratase
MTELLTVEEIGQALAGLDSWAGEGSAITRTVALPSFLAAIGVVDQVALVAEDLDHHPDIDIRWRTLTFRCSTHSIGGVTVKDIGLAHRINEILMKSSGVTAGG